jgi:hypothetical protein
MIDFLADQSASQRTHKNLQPAKEVQPMIDHRIGEMPQQG